MKLSNRPFFNLAAWGYDQITQQDFWRAHVSLSLDAAGDLSKVRRVLDIGCGPGVSAFVIAERFPDAEVIGVDIADKMIERARGHHTRQFSQLTNVSFQVGDATELRFEDDSFDLVLGHSFLYLVPDRPAVLAELRRVLAVGAPAVFLEPRRAGNLVSAAWAARGRIGDIPRHPLTTARFAVSMVLWRVVSSFVEQLTPEKVRGLLQDAAFEDIRIEPTLGGLGLHCVGRA